MRRFLRNALSESGYDVHESETAQRGLAEAAAQRSDIILLDLGLPDLDGLEVINVNALDGADTITVNDLSGTAVTDDGLEELKGLKCIESLNLSRTSVTDYGIAELRKELPKWND